MPKKSLFISKIEIPEGIDIKLDGNKVTVKKGSNELIRTFSYPNVVIKSEDKKILVEGQLKRIVNTFKAHIRNMIEGVTNGYTYKLKVCYSHYPIKLRLEGNELIIDNFVGEKKPRRAKIVDNAKVKIEGNDITVTGIDLDAVSQTAGNIESTTRICGKDRRVFQDGIYIVLKGEKK